MMNHIEIKVPCDLHGRKAVMLCQEFSHLGSLAWIIFANRSIPATSRIGIETLGVKQGDTVTVSFECDEQIIRDIFEVI